jgi:4-diphosphocytidyl-2-C-methyl-D-erythritol kinase
MMLTRLSPAKINLNLHVTGRREDGYHLLDFMAVFTEWGDVLSLKPAKTLELSASGSQAHIFDSKMLSVAKDSPNLIIRAVHLMADSAKKHPDFHIHIEKNIPSGAGLGGGSSNAAAIMHMLNNYWNLNYSLDDLCAIGLELGAELPLCLYERSVRVTGIGDVIEPIQCDHSYNIVIIWPNQSLLTADVFQAYKQSGQAFSQSPIYHIPENKAEFIDILRACQNDLTDSAIELCPDIQTILTQLSESEGCIISRMSGSGSACFGLFDSKIKALSAAQQFDNAIVTTTRIRG